MVGLFLRWLRKKKKLLLQTVNTLPLLRDLGAPPQLVCDSGSVKTMPSPTAVNIHSRANQAAPADCRSRQAGPLRSAPHCAHCLAKWGLQRRRKGGNLCKQAAALASQCHCMGVWRWAALCACWHPAGPAWANCGLGRAPAASRPGGFWERRDGMQNPDGRKTWTTSGVKNSIGSHFWLWGLRFCTGAPVLSLGQARGWIFFYVKGNCGRTQPPHFVPHVFTVMSYVHPFSSNCLPSIMTERNTVSTAW